MTQAFIMNGPVVAMRIKAGSPEMIATVPLEPGQSIIFYDGEEDIETVEPAIDKQSVAFVARVIDHAQVIAVAKLEAASAINAKRDDLWSGACPTDKGPVDCDPVSRINILSALASVAPEGVDWTMADNSIVHHSPDELRAMAEMVSAYVSDVQSRARSLKDDVADASTLADVEKAAAAEWSPSKKEPQ